MNPAESPQLVRHPGLPGIPGLQPLWHRTRACRVEPSRARFWPPDLRCSERRQDLGLEPYRDPLACGARGLACVRVTSNGVTEIVSAPGISYTTFSHEHTREGDAGIHFHNVISRTVTNRHGLSASK